MLLAVGATHIAPTNACGGRNRAMWGYVVQISNNSVLEAFIHEGYIALMHVIDFRRNKEQAPMQRLFQAKAAYFRVPLARLNRGRKHPAKSALAGQRNLKAQPHACQLNDVACSQVVKPC